MNIFDIIILAQATNNTDLFSQLPSQWLTLSFIGLVLMAFWGIFERIGEPAWKGLIPVYNIAVLLEKVERPVWWTLLFFIPLVNVVVAFLISRDVARHFGRGTGIALSLLWLSFICFALLYIF